jgi:hypothetical protein
VGVNEWAPTGKDRKYALVERERRFVLRTAPSEKPVRTVEIVDRYLDGSRIRLRAAATVDGQGAGSVQYKLTQKIPDADGGPGLITSLYLEPDEHRLFDTLAGALLSKTRLSVPPFGVDVFRGSLSGLVLAEAEFSSNEEMAPFLAPAWAGPEVTRDPAFSGGQLVRTTRSGLRRALARYGLSLPTAATIRSK